MAHAAPPRVVATEAATRLIDTLIRRYGPLMLFQSGGCCEDSAPMCYPLGEFDLSQTDVCMGTLCGTPLYVGLAELDLWQRMQMIVDVVEGAGGMFSLENGTGKRFLTRSRPFTDEEREDLARTPAGSVRNAAE